MNVQIAGNSQRRRGRYRPGSRARARHDAYAFEASGLKELLEQVHSLRKNCAADLGYIGVDGIGIVPFKRLSGSGAPGLAA